MLRHRMAMASSLLKEPAILIRRRYLAFRSGLDERRAGRVFQESGAATAASKRKVPGNRESPWSEDFKFG